MQKIIDINFEKIVIIFSQLLRDKRLKLKISNLLDLDEGTLLLN